MFAMIGIPACFDSFHLPRLCLIESGCESLHGGWLKQISG